MKNKRAGTKLIWGALVVLAVMIAGMFLPGVTTYVHSRVDHETAVLFPGSVRLLDLMLKGTDALPTEAVPALHLLDTGRTYLIAAYALIICACACLFFIKGRRGSVLAAALALLGIAADFTFTIQLSNICSSLLFQLLISSTVWIYLPIVCGAALVILSLLTARRSEDRLGVSDAAWRRISAVFSLLALLCMLLPFAAVNVPETVTDDPADSAAMNRSTSVITQMLAKEGNLNGEKAQGHYAKVLSGDLEALEPYSDDGYNINGIFLIKKITASMNVYLLVTGILLAVSAVLALIPKVDKWFSAGMQCVAVVVMALTVISTMTVTDADMYGNATRQLLHVGVGHVTCVPMLMLLLTLGAFLSGAAGIRVSNVPYFKNPLPKNRRVMTASLALAAVGIVLILLPGFRVSFYKPGKTKVTAEVSVSSIDSMMLRTDDSLSAPSDKNGKVLYKEKAKDGQLDAGAVEYIIKEMNWNNGIMLWETLIFTAAGVVCILIRADKKLIVALFVTAGVIRAVNWLLISLSFPPDLGYVDTSTTLYVSIPLLMLAGFVGSFSMREEIPKKYRLFLMLVPFLAAVFLFSYLPLTGWKYAFYDYDFGLPMNRQKFVGFKWFAEMVTNEGHRTNIIRVMKNTLGMSFLGLATSWLPMFFAVFLNEIGNTRFKKFVQIFTTLPNFISWALVFAFAMAMFSMETGIFSKFMLAIGAIDKPVAWLNSKDNIWLKMWGWSTWKGLGWSSIMYLAAISGIDQEMYEAAKVDGAGRWRLIRHITLPGLMPTFFVLLLLSISNIINSGMDQYLVFQNPMNKESIEVLDLYVYNITIASRGTTLYSFGTAIGILKTFVSIILLFSANFASKKLRGESIV